MKGLCKKIGQLNARFVPLDNNDYYINSINKWLRKILFYKFGFSSTNPPWKNNDNQDTFVSLIAKHKIHRPIPLQRFFRLWLNASSNLNNQPNSLVIYLLEDLVERYPDNVFNNTWIIPPKIYDVIIKHFNIMIERTANPFTFHLGLNSYSSTFSKDKIFGSQGNSINHLWEYNSILTPKFDIETIYSYVSLAINSSIYASSRSFIFLPLWENEPTLKHIMRDKNLTLICRWPANSRILSPITYSPTPSKIDIGLFATNLKRTQIPWFYLNKSTFNRQFEPRISNR